MRLLLYILVDPLRTLTVLFWASLNSTSCETQNKLDFNPYRQKSNRLAPGVFTWTTIARKKNAEKCRGMGGQFVSFKGEIEHHAFE